MRRAGFAERALLHRRRICLPHSRISRCRSAPLGATAKLIMARPSFEEAVMVAPSALVVVFQPSGTQKRKPLGWRKTLACAVREKATAVSATMAAISQTLARCEADMPDLLLGAQTRLLCRDRRGTQAPSRGGGRRRRRAREASRSPRDAPRARGGGARDVGRVNLWEPRHAQPL
ncbi:MAG: hypothetical protein EB084_03610 [Proteobacteria bacterium]|nr:hypothetical protein [Pseudomonadota bacterium]